MADNPAKDAHLEFSVCDQPAESLCHAETKSYIHVYQIHYRAVVSAIVLPLRYFM